MKNFICVYDFETDGTNPNKCQPVQLASCMIHPRTLEIVPESEFMSFMRPENISDEYRLQCEDVLVWHTQNYNKNYHEFSPAQQKEAVDKVYDTWVNAPDQKQVFTNFCEYLRKYNINQKNKNKFGAPLRAGMNIKRFDNTIIDRLCTKYKKVSTDGEQLIFHPAYQVDILEFAFYWFENLQEPARYNMAELREFFGMSQDGAHDALVDVHDEAKIIQKFLKLHRHLAPKINFKNSLAKTE